MTVGWEEGAGAPCEPSGDCCTIGRGRFSAVVCFRIRCRFARLADVEASLAVFGSGRFWAAASRARFLAGLYRGGRFWTISTSARIEPTERREVPRREKKAARAVSLLWSVTGRVRKGISRWPGTDIRPSVSASNVTVALGVATRVLAMSSGRCRVYATGVGTPSLHGWALSGGREIGVWLGREDGMTFCWRALEAI